MYPIDNCSRGRERNFGSENLIRVRFRICNFGIGHIIPSIFTSKLCLILERNARSKIFGQNSFESQWSHLFLPKGGMVWNSNRWKPQSNDDWWLGRPSVSRSNCVFCPFSPLIGQSVGSPIWILGCDRIPGFVHQREIERSRLRGISCRADNHIAFFALTNCQKKRKNRISRCARFAGLRGAGCSFYFSELDQKWDFSTWSALEMH